MSVGLTDPFKLYHMDSWNATKSDEQYPCRTTTYILNCGSQVPLPPQPDALLPINQVHSYGGELTVRSRSIDPSEPTACKPRGPVHDDTAQKLRGPGIIVFDSSMNIVTPRKTKP